jgi:hypothetical protein
MSSLYEYLPLFDADPEGRRAATEVALCELVQSGVTTVCDLSAAREDWLDTLGGSGMRVYVAPMFRSAAGTRQMVTRCVTPGTNRQGGKGSTARLG